MANEISLTAGLSVNKSGQSISGILNGLAITQSGAQNIGNVQNIGTSSEALSIGDVSTIGYLYIKNLDATNFVTIDLNNPAVASSGYATLKAGEAMVIPTRRTQHYAIADTGACDVYVVALEL